MNNFHCLQDFYFNDLIHQISWHNIKQITNNRHSLIHRNFVATLYLTSAMLIFLIIILRVFHLYVFIMLYSR
jgi:hypothetical protein